MLNELRLIFDFAQKYMNFCLRGKRGLFWGEGIMTN